MTIEIRSVSGYEALERWAEARNAAGPDVVSPHTEALLRATEHEHVDLVAFRGEEAIGTAFLSGDPASLTTGSAFFEVKVVLGHRRRGVGSALHAAIAENARRIGFHRLRCHARADDADSLAFLKRRGFEITRRMDQVSLELDNAARPQPSPPPGIAIDWLAARPEAVGAMYLVALKAADRHRSARATFAGSEPEWRTYELGSALARLDLTALALAEDAVVGYSVVEDFPGHAVLFHRNVVVDPEQEDRGIDGALVRAQIAAAREAGLEAMVAVPKTQPLASLFAELGYEPRKTWLELEGQLT